MQESRNALQRKFANVLKLILLPTANCFLPTAHSLLPTPYSLLPTLYYLLHEYRYEQ